MTKPEIKEALEAAVARHDDGARSKLAELATAMAPVAEKMAQVGEAAEGSAKTFEGFLAVLNEPKWQLADWQTPVWTPYTPMPNPCYCGNPYCKFGITTA